MVKINDFRCEKFAMTSAVVIHEEDAEILLGNVHLGKNRLCARPTNTRDWLNISHLSAYFSVARFEPKLQNLLTFISNRHSKK